MFLNAVFYYFNCIATIKKLRYYKIMKRLIKHLVLLFCVSLVLSGCATLTYTGNDYDVNNVQTVKTDDDFVFNVYKKNLDNINIKTGISKTPVPEILALYVQIENLSYETPYIFKVEDLRLSNDEKELQFITTTNYLNIWQTQEASSMAAMANVGNSLTTMAGMTANYNDYNQSIAQNSSEQSKNSAFSRLETIGNNISKHSVKYSSTISPRRSQYFYFFFEDLDKFPIYIKYKTLNWQYSL